MLILVLAFLMVLVMWVAKVYMVSNVNSSKVGFLSSGTSWFVILWMDVKLSCISCEKITVDFSGDTTSSRFLCLCDLLGIIVDGICHSIKIFTSSICIVRSGFC